MQTNDGHFIISAPDDAEMSLRTMYPQYDEVIDINMEAIEENITLFHVAYAISVYCFGVNKGLLLRTKSLRCHLTVGKNKYDFTVKEGCDVTSYIEQLAKEVKL